MTTIETLQSQIDTLTKQVAELEAKLEEKGEAAEESNVLYEHADSFGKMMFVFRLVAGELGVQTEGNHCITLPAPEATKFAEAIAKWARLRPGEGPNSELRTSLASMAAYYKSKGIDEATTANTLDEANNNNRYPIPDEWVLDILKKVYGATP